MNDEEKDRWHLIKPMVSPDEKIEELKEKLREEPNNTNYLRDLAFLLIKQRRFDECLELFKKVIELGNKELEIEIIEFIVNSLKDKPVDEKEKSVDEKEKLNTKVVSAPVVEEETKETVLSLIPYRKGDRWGFCDKNKVIIIEPMYDEVGTFSEGLAAVKLNGKWGFVDTKGNVVIELKYNNVFSFYEGRAMVEFKGKSAYVDKKGIEYGKIK
jgi:tetratricopeptide (TPR) repeat protein